MARTTIEHSYLCIRCELCSSAKTLCNLLQNINVKQPLEIINIKGKGMMLVKKHISLFNHTKQVKAMNTIQLDSKTNSLHNVPHLFFRARHMDII